jgi:type VI protein secretion system component Hcp
LAACDVSVVKNLDSAGPALWAAAASGLTFPQMTIVVLKSGFAPGPGAPIISRLYDIRLSNVRIGSVESSAGDTDSSETITLQPQGVTITYFVQQPDGTPGNPISQSFSCK